MASDYRVELYSPVENGGQPLHYNWFGADRVDLIGKHTKGNTGSGHLSYPGQSNQSVFSYVGNNSWASGHSRPTYNIGLLNNTNNHNSDYFYVTACPCGANVQKNLKGYNKGVPGPNYNDKGELKYLFEEGGAHHRGFITDFYGNYNNTEKKKYYQNFAFEVLNTSAGGETMGGSYYPFAVKGIAFTIRVPAGSDNLDAYGRKNQYGDHLQINYMHGLWVDRDGKFHQHELLPNGDNAGKAKVTALRTPNWSTDPAHTPYFFLRSGSTTGTYEFLRDNFPDTNEAMKIRAFTTNPEVEHLWFVGFSCSISTDKAGGEAFSHTLQWSNLAPIPFFSPRPPMSFKHTAVLGELTPLRELREGQHKIKNYEGRKTRGSFKSSDTTYLPDNVVPGYGENDDFDPPPPGSDDPDAAPDVFEFEDVKGSDINETHISNTVVVTGFNGRILMYSDKNSEISVEEGAWVSGGTSDLVPILPDQSFRLRMTAPEFEDMSISTECVVGGSDPVVWTIDTGDGYEIPDVPLDMYYIPDPPEPITDSPDPDKVSSLRNINGGANQDPGTSHTWQSQDQVRGLGDGVRVPMRIYGIAQVRVKPNTPNAKWTTFQHSGINGTTPIAVENGYMFQFKYSKLNPEYGESTNSWVAIGDGPWIQWKVDNKSEPSF